MLLFVAFDTQLLKISRFFLVQIEYRYVSRIEFSDQIKIVINIGYDAMIEIPIF